MGNVRFLEEILLLKTVVTHFQGTKQRNVQIFAEKELMLKLWLIFIATWN
jgi:hypothetical protein